MSAQGKLGRLFRTPRPRQETAKSTFTAAIMMRGSTQRLFAQTERISRLICALAITTLVPQVVGQTNVLPDAHLEQATDQADDAKVPSKPLSSNEPSVLHIGTGDLLEISVSTGFGAPEVNWKGRVSSSGDITLPLLGSFHVAGLPADQAEAMVKKAYKDAEILKDPQVSVFIKEYASQGVSVLGEVAKPGVYPVMTSRRLLDVISEAGGLTPLAGKTIAITHRGKPVEVQTVLLPRDPSQTLADNVDIFPGDTIVVGKAGVIYVVGAVGKPGGFTMDANEGLTVLQAIALAQGSKSEASLDKSKLIRKTAAGPEEIPIPLGQIFSSKVPDLKLQADDIVFVPTSRAKSAARRSMEAIIQVATGVIIYHPL